MPSLSTLNIAVSALRASQYAMDITANNIANAGTEGYHRQEAVFLPGASVTSGAVTACGGVMQLGTGVQLDTVQRAQTSYIDDQVRMSNQWLGQANYKNGALKQIESFLAEPTDQGLSATLDHFWNSWSNLATSPESDAARSDVVAKAQELCQKINNLHSNLTGIQATADQNMIDDVKQINSLAHDIAGLNVEISRNQALGGQPNDLLDRRDVLIDQLSKITQIQTSNPESGDLIVSISGKALVQGNVVTDISVADGPNGWSAPVWSDDNTAVQVKGGEMAAQLSVRDDTVEGYIRSLNDLAGTIVQQVNTLHSSGVTRDGNPAGDFFVAGSDASNIAVDPQLVAQPRNVATSTSAASGGHDIADSIAKLQTATVVGGQSINDVYSGIVAQIGSDSRESDTQVDTQTASLQQLSSQRQSVAGVSMDEEMANMVKFQQSYNAAARIFTVIDEMMDTVVNKLGVQ